MTVFMSSPENPAVLFMESCIDRYSYGGADKITNTAVAAKQSNSGSTLVVKK